MRAHLIVNLNLVLAHLWYHLMEIQVLLLSLLVFHNADPKHEVKHLLVVDLYHYSHEAVSWLHSMVVYLIKANLVETVMVLRLVDSRNLINWHIFPVKEVRYLDSE